MRKLAIASMVLSALVVGCSEEKTPQTDKAVALVADKAIDTSNKATNLETNPFFQEYETPFGIPPFDKITDAHYAPAFDRSIAEAKAEILAVANSPAEPTFENTIVALEYSAKLLTKVANVFFNLTSAHTNDNLKALAKDIGPRLSGLNDDLNLNPALFKRVEAIHNKIDSLELNTEQKKLLVDRYREFIRGGAGLNEDDKNTLRELNAKISKLGIEFGDNVLAETNSFELVVDNKEDLAGLPQHLIDAAAETGTKRGKEGKWVFTTHRPSKTPFLIYSENRDLREKMWKGYTHRGDNNNTNDNKKIVAEIAAIRAQKAQLLGYKTHAHFVLEGNTAKNPENVYGLLDKVWPAGLAQAKQELADMQALVDKEGGNYKVEGWDWRHLAEKIRKARYDLDEEQTKPYFSLEDTLKGVFYTVNKLYGMTFKERTDLPVYHDDVRVFEVYYKNGELIGLYLTDHYVRESKRGGAWMNAYRSQYVTEEGEFVKPIIVNVLNYPRPTGDKPTLLTFGQASTLFHEFGHAAHGFLSNGVYPSQAGTSVPRDFVEFPSQVLENWMFEPEVLSKFAKHYETGEVIPQALIEKIQAASKFGQGFATTEYMAASLLDLAWHTQTETTPVDTNAFEKSILEERGLIRQIAPRYRSTYFSHIFSDGYSSGYYGYIWSEILAADAFNAFKENGIFDQATAEAFRANVLSKGGTDDPMKLYRQFRGQEPDPKHLLKSRGLATE
ncbi:MAG: M3 family metallopeptidase [Kangiellaceae bacterium]|nr:M3 family metallopeptidase [Kangiellaceae bacterium]